MKVKIDQKRCIECDLCGEVSEDIINAKNGPAILEPKSDLQNPETLAKIKLAIECCPQQVIKIEG